MSVIDGATKGLLSFPSKRPWPPLTFGHQVSTRFTAQITMPDTTNDSDRLVEALKWTNLTSGVSPHPSFLPRTMATSVHVDGMETHVWVQVFRERLVFGVSQYQGSIGNFVMCEPTQSLINMKQVHYEVTNLLGAREETLLNVYAQQLCELIVSTKNPGDPLPTVVLGITLHKERSKEPAMFRTILGILGQVYEDAMRL